MEKFLDKDSARDSNSLAMYSYIMKKMVHYLDPYAPCNVRALKDLELLLDNNEDP